MTTLNKNIKTKKRNAFRGENLESLKFGKWMVIKYVDNGKWECKCDCGTIKEITKTVLKNHKSLSCGCAKLINLLGQQFGRLTVKEEVQYNGYRAWKCNCECGNNTTTRTSSLLNGSTKSCGCLSRESGRKKHKDISSKVFGKLIVIELSEFKNGTTYWKCLCECGSTIIRKLGNLISGNTKTCGCSHKRKGKDSPLFNSSLTEEERNRRKDNNFRNWSKEVKLRDGWQCQLSGERNKIVSHHLYNFKDNADLRYSVDNGITLSEKLHNLFHSLYGQRYNTPVQFEEFKTRYNNGEFINKL